MKRKGFSYGPSSIKYAPRQERVKNEFNVNIFRVFFGFVCLLYALLIIILYSTSYIHLITGNTYKSEMRSILMLWNSFKPMVVLIFIYCCTQKSMSLWKCFIFGSFVGCVFIGTFIYLLVMTYDYLHNCNNADSEVDNACNDLLYCCVHYNSAPFCFGKGPCYVTSWNTSDVNNTNTNSSSSTSNATTTRLIINSYDLKANSNFKLGFWLFLLSFILEFILLYMFFIVLNSINLGSDLFMDTRFQYAYPTIVQKTEPTYNPSEGDKPTSYYDEFVSGAEKQHIPTPVLKTKQYLQRFKILVKNKWEICKAKCHKVHSFIWYNIKELFVLHSGIKPTTAPTTTAATTTRNVINEPNDFFNTMATHHYKIDDTTTSGDDMFPVNHYGSGGGGGVGDTDEDSSDGITTTVLGTPFPPLRNRNFNESFNNKVF